MASSVCGEYKDDVLAIDFNDFTLSDDDTIASSTNDEEDDDDDIIVTINNDQIHRVVDKKQLELSKIDALLSSTKIQDDEIQAEIENLICKSIEAPLMYKFITILIDNRYIIVNYNTELTDQLKSYVWRAPRAYIYRPLFYIDSLNSIIRHNEELPDIYAIFSVKYDKINNNVRKTAFGNQKPASSATTSYYKNKTNALYVYVDFTIIIIECNKIVDYAIHGVHSNIHEAVSRWKPKKIIYNAEENDPLHTFLNYKNQPFYDIIHSLGCPMKIFRNQKIVSLALCERNDVFCSFCNGLKDFLGLTNFYQQTIVQQHGAIKHYRRAPYTRYNPYKQPQLLRRNLTVLKKQ